TTSRAPTRRDHGQAAAEDAGQGPATRRARTPSIVAGPTTSPSEDRQALIAGFALRKDRATVELHPRVRAELVARADTDDQRGGRRPAGEQRADDERSDKALRVDRQWR